MTRSAAEPYKRPPMRYSALPATDLPSSPQTALADSFPARYKAPNRGRKGRPAMQDTKRIPGAPLDLRGCRVSQADGIVVAIGTNRLQHRREHDQADQDQQRDLDTEHRDR
jgi:hypothetical protein